MMKFAVFFLVCFVALAAAAPQWLTYPGVYPGGVYPGVAPYVPRTIVAGPSVYNGYGNLGRYIAPGYIGHGFY